MERYLDTLANTNIVARSNSDQMKGAGQLGFRNLFLHAWDVADKGADSIMAWMQRAGLNTMCLAGTYHEGWFIHPHHSRHRGFMTEGSVCYFRPDEACYRRTKLRPKPSQLCRKTDWFREAGKRLDKHGLRLVSWTIGTHNTRLGCAHPELTQQNVYGDRLPHALCPANRDVREYLLALCRDLATNHPLWGIQLESFGWNGFAHGHHHERDLTGLTPFECELMGLCVCPACKREAAKAGVDVMEVKAAIRKTLDGVFCEAPDRSKKHPRSMTEFESRFVEMATFNSWRKAFGHGLIGDIKRVALKGTDCRLLVQTPFEPELANEVDGFACIAYQTSPAETKRICRQATAWLKPQSQAIHKEARKAGVVSSHSCLPGFLIENWNGLLQCLIQLGMGVPESERQLAAIITAVRDGGCNGINFYNHSESPPKMLNWLEKVLPRFANVSPDC